MANLNLTPSEFADLVVSFLFDVMVNPGEIVVTNESFQELIQLTGKLGAKPHFMKYYLDLNANDRTNYKRFKRTLEPGAGSKSILTVNPVDVKEPKKDGLTKIAKAVIKKLLLQQTVTPEELQLLKEYTEEKE